MKLVTVIVLLILVCNSKAFLSSFLIPQNHWDAPEFQFHHQKQEETWEIKLQNAQKTIEIFNRLALQKDAKLKESQRINLQLKKQIFSLNLENLGLKTIAHQRYIQILDYQSSVDILFQNVTNRHDSLVQQKNAEICQKDAKIIEMKLEFENFQINAEQVKNELDQVKMELEQRNAENAQKDSTIKEMKKKILDFKAEIFILNEELEEKDSQISKKDQEISNKETTITQKKNYISRLKTQYFQFRKENSEFRKVLKSMHENSIKQESQIQSYKETQESDKIKIKECDETQNKKTKSISSIEKLKVDVNLLSGKLIKETKFFKRSILQ
jgi:hypothetical protein